MTNTGRNNPCPCKSGKKYKVCCLGKENTNIETSNLKYSQKYSTVQNDPEWTKIRVAEGDIAHILENYVKEEFGNSFYKIAWSDFKEGKTSSEDRQAYDYYFKSWIHYSWPLESESSLDDEELTVVKMCLKEYPNLFTSYQKRLLEALEKSTFSFFIVKEAIPGQRLFIKDIFLQKDLELKETTASKTLESGDIILCYPVTLDGQSIAIGMAPHIVPNRFFDVILEYRDWILKSEHKSILHPEELKNYEIELRELYFEIIEKASEPAQFSNTDGESIVLHEIFYDIKCPPSEVFEALIPLCAEEYAERYENGTFDAKGNLVEIILPWVKINEANAIHDNVSLGNFTITSKKLKVFVNSKERAAKATKEIQTRLGGKVSFKNQKTTPMSNSKDVQKQNKKSASKETPLEYTPEIIEALKKHIEKTWVKWLDTSLPILGNETPRKAAKSKTGREKLEALFLNFERTNKNLKLPDEEYQRIDIDFLKKELHLI